MSETPSSLQEGIEVSLRPLKSARRDYAPVRPAVADGAVDRPDGHKDDERLVRVELEVKRLTNSPAEEDEDGDDEERDLDRRADGDGEREVELVLGRNRNGRDVLGGIADDGEEDEAVRQGGA